MKRIKHMKLPVTARVAILMALSESSYTPVDLREKLAECDLTVSNGSLYPALKEMIQEGLVASVEGSTITHTGCEAEGIYGLTRKGRKAAEAERGKILRLLLGPPSMQVSALMRISSQVA